MTREYELMKMVERVEEKTWEEEDMKSIVEVQKGKRGGRKNINNPPPPPPPPLSLSLSLSLFLSHTCQLFRLKRNIPLFGRR